LLNFIGSGLPLSKDSWFKFTISGAGYGDFASALLPVGLDRFAPLLS